MGHAVRSALALLLTLAPGLLARALAEEKVVYRPVAAKVGKSLVAPPELLSMVDTLRAAARGGDREAVFALVADDVTFVSGGITATVARRVEKRTFGPERADEALAAIGLAFTEGEPVGAGGQTFDFTKSRVATALTRIAEELGSPDWASDPLAPGARCTKPGASWDAKAAEKAGLKHRAVFFLTPTEARMKPDAGAKVVTRLASGRLWAIAESEETDGWTPVALDDGRTGWVSATAAKTAHPWGFCFLPNVEGGWLLSAVISSLN